MVSSTTLINNCFNTFLSCSSLGNTVALASNDVIYYLVLLDELFSLLNKVMFSSTYYYPDSPDDASCLGVSIGWNSYFFLFLRLGLIINNYYIL